MSIVIDSASGVITLHTRHTSYQMKADALGTLLHTYYGPRTDESDLSYAIFRLNRGLSGNPHEIGNIDRSYSLDTLQQEISCFGTGDYRTTALKMRLENGAEALKLKFKDAAVTSGKYSIPGLPASYEDGDEGAETLTVFMEDPEAGVEAELYYGVFPEKDMLTRA
ncbi:MAG: alpha-galactosidase, partial [Lachnospiraceae bacterium]|nr:alpha-galactosidase [Lachnospiraceae bacterium]